MHALVLAAGYGTRLGGLSEERPKPLLPVCDQPLVRWVARWCVEQGVGRLGVNLHHMGELIRADLDDGRAVGAQISYSYEPEILGTGGGIRALARLMPRQTCVVVNAKIVGDVDLGAALVHHRRLGAIATMVLYAVPDAERWGAIGADDEGHLTRLLDRRRGEVAAEGMFTGIHLLEPEFVEAIPDGPCCVIRTAYSELFARGAPLAARVHRGYFHEHSTPQRYLEGNFNLLEGCCERPGGAPLLLRGAASDAEVAADAEVVQPVLIAARARIESGARVGPRVVIGSGSLVGRRARIADSVVWPGSQVAAGAELVSSIVTPAGVVKVPRAPGS